MTEHSPAIEITGMSTYSQPLRVYSFGSTWKPDWEYVDAGGDFHSWVGVGEIMVNGTPYTETHYADGDEWESTRWECSLCGEWLAPARVTSDLPVLIPGPVERTVTLRSGEALEIGRCYTVPYKDDRLEVYVTAKHDTRMGLEYEASVAP